jgi:hypothetical protein
MEQSRFAIDHGCKHCELYSCNRKKRGKQVKQWLESDFGAVSVLICFDDVKLVPAVLSHKPNSLLFHYHQASFLRREALLFSGFITDRLMMANTCFSAGLNGGNYFSKNLTLRNINLQLNLGY